MRKLIIIPFLFICLLLSAQDTYYVDPAGDDGAVGDITHPWKTWGKAFNDANVDPGDTVYFRDGIYYKAWGEGVGNYHADGKSYQITRAGTAGNYVHYFAYPGETPILDSDNIVPETNLNYAIRGGADYTWFKGLHIRNVWSVEGGIGGSSVECFGWKAEGNHAIIENCKIYNTHGIGVQLTGSGDTIMVINCDAWNHCDSFAVAPQHPGNRGSGFTVLVNPTSTTAYYSFIHCRAWNCGDQGFSGGWIGRTKFEGCWSFCNGQLQGEGHGYKLGWAIANGTVHDVINCLAVYNKCDGFRTNDAARLYVRRLNVYNNTAYQNGDSAGYYGFVIYNTATTDALELLRTFKNNISYQTNGRNIYVATNALYTHEYNTWDIPLTVADANFISVDTAGITGARDADGHLPNLDFLNISDGSQLIGAGIGVGLVYDADSMLVNQDDPDLGLYAYSPEPPPPPPLPPQVTTNEITSYSPYKATVTAEILDDGGGTIGAKGIVWGTAINPTLSNNSVAGWATSSTEFWNVVRALNPNTTYYFRAYVGNENDTTYGEVRTLITPQMGALKNGTKAIKNGTKIVIY